MPRQRRCARCLRISLCIYYGRDTGFAERDALMDYLRAAEAEEALLIRYIEEIPDSDVRELFMLRYVDGVRSWQRIAFLAGEHDESYVRRKHDRYINKEKK